MSDAGAELGAIRPGHPEPLWVQAVDVITAEIESGALQPGMRLPPERELCERLGISRMTLRKALNQLVEQGVLSPSHGRGWYVADPGAAPAPARDWPNRLESFTETATRMGLTATSRVLRAELVPATLDDAELLLVAPGTSLFALERVRLLGGVPIAVDSSLFPAARLSDPLEIDFARESVYAQLEARGATLARAEATIEAKAADAALASQLDVAEGMPVLVLSQLVVDDNGHPVLSSVIRYSGDRYRLRTQFARGGGRPTSRSRRSGR